MAADSIPDLGCVFGGLFGIRLLYPVCLQKAGGSSEAFFIFLGVS